MEKATISIDIGSSGIRCCAFDLHGRQIAAGYGAARLTSMEDRSPRQDTVTVSGTPGTAALSRRRETGKKD